MTRSLMMLAVASALMALTMVSSATAAVLPAPEIDASAVGSVLSLVVGGVLVLTGRRNRK